MTSSLVGSEMCIRDRSWRELCSVGVCLVAGQPMVAWCAEPRSPSNEAIVTTLFERARWKRTTVDGRKSFSVYWAYLSACGAVHVEDISD
eukprot:6351579-Prorocentrum_lima.AAC.1